jgi:hypothetical protein
VGVWAEWRRARLQNTQVLKHPTNYNWGRGPGHRGGRACEAAKIGSGYFRVKALARRSPCGTAVVTTAGLLVLSSQFSHRLVTVSLIHRAFHYRSGH